MKYQKESFRAESLNYVLSGNGHYFAGGKITNAKGIYSSFPDFIQFSDAILEKRNEFDKAIILVNNATETQWLFQLLESCNIVCFHFGRIKFIDMNGNPSGAPLQGQCILYFGNDEFRFASEFKRYGICMREAL